MARPKDGDVFVVPLPDGTNGLAQVLTNDMVVVFGRRYSGTPSASEALSAPVAFRTILSPEYWRGGQWTKIGSSPVNPSNVRSLRVWACRPDFTGYLFEWRYRQPTLSLGDVSLREAVGSVPNDLPCTEAELWLFRFLEGIPYDPWWGLEHDGVSIPWALPRPPGYDYSWAESLQPDTLDAPARDKLLRSSARTDDTPSRDDALVTWHDSAAAFVNELADARARQWPARIEAALELASTGTSLSVDECGQALGASFLLGIAGGADLARNGVSRDVLRLASKNLKAATQRKLAPIAAAALEGILRPENEMASLLSEADDFPSFVERVTRLRDWFRGAA